VCECESEYVCVSVFVFVCAYVCVHAYLHVFVCGFTAKRVVVSLSLLLQPASNPMQVFEGVCTTYMQQLPVGAVVDVFLRVSKFKLPKQLSCPVIMIGDGDVDDDDRYHDECNNDDGSDVIQRCPPVRSDVRRGRAGHGFGALFGLSAGASMVSTEIQAVGSGRCTQPAVVRLQGRARRFHPQGHAAGHTQPPPLPQLATPLPPPDLIPSSLPPLPPSGRSQRRCSAAAHGLLPQRHPAPCTPAQVLAPAPAAAVGAR